MPAAWPNCSTEDRIVGTDQGMTTSGGFEPEADQVEVLQSRADRPVVRVGDRVRHPRQASSESVHALLEFLREEGFHEAPRPGALTEETDEVEFIPGTGGDDACLLVEDDDAVAAVGTLLRRYHDTVARWRPTVEPRWFDGRRGVGDGHRELVCHGDVGPWNLVWREHRIVGLIDWEHATVASPRADVAYALHYLAPIRDRSYWQGCSACPVNLADGTG
jgi:hypothetical protein